MKHPTVLYVQHTDGRCKGLFQSPPASRSQTKIQPMIMMVHPVSHHVRYGLPNQLNTHRLYIHMKRPQHTVLGEHDKADGSLTVIGHSVSSCCCTRQTRGRAPREACNSGAAPACCAAATSRLQHNCSCIASSACNHMGCACDQCVLDDGQPISTVLFRNPLIDLQITDWLPAVFLLSLDISAA
jgi:hypothetical protein